MSSLALKAPSPLLPAMPHAAAPRIRSETLFQSGNKEVLIEHRGECYRLRLTRQDKLILNK